MIKRQFAVLLLGILFVIGQTGAADADKYLERGDFLLRNVTVIDGLGNAPLAGQDIYIRQGKIAAITATGEEPVPAGAG